MGHQLWIKSIGYKIYVSKNQGETWDFEFKLLGSKISCFLGLFNGYLRLFRKGVHWIECIDKTILVIFVDRSIYHYNLSTKCLKKSVDAIVGSRPLSLCKTHENELLYGEYRSNPEKSSIKVLSSQDHGLTWTPIYKFNNIRHIHGVFHDPYTNWIWITTGDSNEESAIWVTKDHFSTVEIVSSGSQQTRAVTLLFTQAHIYFGSDTELEQNYINRLNRSTQKIEQLQSIEGSVFWGNIVNNTLFFSTVCEPSRINLSKWCSIWMSSDGTTWDTVCKMKRGWLPLKYFQYAQIRFPIGQNNTNKLYFSSFSTRNSHQTYGKDLT